MSNQEKAIVEPTEFKHNKLIYYLSAIISLVFSILTIVFDIIESRNVESEFSINILLWVGIIGALILVAPNQMPYQKEKKWSFYRLIVVLLIFPPTFFLSRFFSPNIDSILGIGVALVGMGAYFLPAAIFDLNTGYVPPKIEQLKEFDTSYLKEGIKSVKQSYRSIEKQISEVSRKLDIDTHKFLEEVNVKNQELKSVNRKLEKNQEELDYYRNLISLDKPQIKAISKTLKKKRYHDILLGGFIAFLISAFFWWLSERSDSKLILDSTQIEHVDQQE